jgi:hypothetical protein
MSSKTEPLNIEDKIVHSSNKNLAKDGFYVKKNHALILSVIISILFAGSIIATYFGKPDGTYQKYTLTSGMLKYDNVEFNLSTEKFFKLF